MTSAVAKILSPTYHLKVEVTVQRISDSLGRLLENGYKSRYVKIIIVHRNAVVVCITRISNRLSDASGSFRQAYEL